MSIISRLTMTYIKPAFTYRHKISNKLRTVNIYEDCFGKKWIAEGKFRFRTPFNEKTE